jgi:DNA (cytosine-5)-methyltransferase 1
MNFYNEIDPGGAEWIRNLIKEGMIPQGVVDERSIVDIEPEYLDQFTQCHFFAGIGGWSYALRLAGWDGDRKVWTGSCPCQPFSVAGEGRGIDDERHLWPAFRWLISQCRPSTVFGEQVASADGRDWASGVRDDLEIMGYDVGIADLCAAGVGADHIRQRLFWGGRLAENAASNGRGRGTNGNQAGDDREIQIAGLCADGRLADSGKSGLEGFSGDVGDGDKPGWIGTVEAGSVAQGCKLVGWGNTILWPCRDGKIRRVPARNERMEIEPSLFPLADGIPGHVVVVRPTQDGGTEAEETRWVSRRSALFGSGNAIVPEVGAEFVMAFDETWNELTTNKEN